MNDSMDFNLMNTSNQWYNKTDVFHQILVKENGTIIHDTDAMYSLKLIIPFTIIYTIIFVTGVVGNVSTCIVIAKNKSMHTATNYYLFSLAISDMLLLISGLPPEMYRTWCPDTYIFGGAFCFIQGFAAETSANATVLTITAFTIERYLAICHPFLSHTMSKLSRAVRFIVAIWIVAMCLAIPQAIQFGIQDSYENGKHSRVCTVVSQVFEHAFELSTFLFFVGPMTLITVLYVLIGVQLRKSKNLAGAKKSSLSSNANESGRMLRNTKAQNRVVKMLIAVVVAFFICWAPFHAQRLLAVYMLNASPEAQETGLAIYTVLVYTSGVAYYLSTTINPVLYHILSHKFREAFKKTGICGLKISNDRNYSIIRRDTIPIRSQRSVSEDMQRAPSKILLRANSAPTKDQTIAFSMANFERSASLKIGESAPNNSTSKNPAKSVYIDCNNLEKQALCQSSPAHNGTKHSNNLRRENGNINEKYQMRIFTNKMFKMFHKPNIQVDNKFFRAGSSGSTNTISNSSLQDMDDKEFSNTDLVKYMKEINELT